VIEFNRACPQQAGDSGVMGSVGRRAEGGKQRRKGEGGTRAREKSRECFSVSSTE